MGPRKCASLGQVAGRGRWLAWVAAQEPEVLSPGDQLGPLGQRAGAAPWTPAVLGGGQVARLRLCSPRPPAGPERLGAFCGRAAGGRPLCGAVGKSWASLSQPLKGRDYLGLRGHPLRDIPPGVVGAGRLRRSPAAKPWPHRPLGQEGPPEWTPRPSLPASAIQLPGSEPPATQGGALGEPHPLSPRGALLSDGPGSWPFGGHSPLPPHSHSWADSGQAQGCGRGPGWEGGVCTCGTYCVRAGRAGRTLIGLPEILRGEQTNSCPAEEGTNPDPAPCHCHAFTPSWVHCSPSTQPKSFPVPLASF